MASPDLSGGGDNSASFWGGIVFLIAGIPFAFRYITNLFKKEQHVVLEAADLADMGPIRQAVQKLDKLLEIRADVEQTRKDIARILFLIDRMDREDVIEREVTNRVQVVLDRENANRKGRRLDRNFPEPE